MKRYEGSCARTGECVVHTYDGARRRKLPLYLKVFNHSPTGFGWGYLGSGPAQLALAILMDLLHDKDRAVKLHQPFKEKVIARLAQNRPWVLVDNEVREHVERIETGYAIR